MSSGKRYSDANTNSNALFDKGGSTTHSGTGVVHRNTATHIGSQGNKPRGRSTSGTAPARLQVPKPVILPSKKKERSQEQPEGQTQLAPSSTGVLGWQQRLEEPSTVDQGTWTHHAAPRAALWNRGGHHDDPPTSSARPSVLDQEEFPSLLVAAQTKGHSGKPKLQKLPESKENKVWTDDGQTSPSRTRPSRSTWEDDERFGMSGEMQMPYGPLPMQHPGYVPMDGHGMPPEGYYAHPYYHPRPAYYAPHPGAVQPGYRAPDYYGPVGEGYYAPYMQPVYPHPHFPHGYQHPDMYHDHNLFPPMPQSAPKLPTHPSQGTIGENGKEDFVPELKLKTAEPTDKIKAEAEHPKTPDNLSGEGTIRLIDRQGSADDRAHVPDPSSQRSLLRRKSLPKSASQRLKSRVNSEDLDWGAQVDAEENFWMKHEVGILAKPAQETLPAVSSPLETDQKGPDGSTDVPLEATSSEGWRASHSPMSKEASGRDGSADASTRRSDKSSSVPWRSGGSFQHHPHHDRWPMHSSGTATPSTRHAHPIESPQRPSSVHEGWRGRRDGAYRGRSFRGRDGGRIRGRGGRFLQDHRDHPASPAVAEGRKHFPGRGFRPKGIPPRQGPSRPQSTDASDDPESKIQFGRFDLSLQGDYDPFSGSVPVFETSHSENVGKKDRIQRLPDSLSSDLTAPFAEPRLSMASSHVDTATADSFGDEISSDVRANNEERRNTPRRVPASTPRARSHGDGERHGARGRHPFGYRGRGRGRWSHGRHGGSIDRFRHHSSFSSAAGTPTESERGFRSEGHPSASHRWSQDFSSRGRGDWHHRPYDRNQYHHKPPGRGSYGRGRARGGREGGRSYQNFSQDPTESSVRPTASNTRMQWVPKKPSAEVTEKERPAEE